jgi:magnesium transporter
MTQPSLDPETVTLPAEEPAPEPSPRERLHAMFDNADIQGALELALGLHPAELADALEALTDDERAALISALDPETAADALYYVEPHFRGELLRGLPPDTASKVLGAVADDIATDIVQELDPEAAEAVLASIPVERRRAVERLLTHDEHSAGGRMTGQVVTVRPHFTAEQTIEIVRGQRPNAAQPFYLYVTDARRRLLGVLNFRTLISAPPETVVSDLMQTDLITVPADADQEEAARLLKQYKLLALPVVDSIGHLLGTVTSDDLLDVLEDEATEDMFRIVGVNEEEDLRNVGRSIRYRLPWLSVNLLTALLAGYVVSLFQGTLGKAVVLAAFLPVIAGQGGNAGIQTVTVVVRSLALGRVTPSQVARVLGHELLTGLVVGATTGALVGLVALAWQGNAWLGVLVGLAMAADVLVGAFFGTLIPMGLQRIGQDPALSSGIWLTTTTDVMGFLIYLGLATMLIVHLQ